jgi:bifunctional DNA-binding transcriptional regulator/antitoxin component of YhaV-PrlF toxin-antitoxin module
MKLQKQVAYKYKDKTHHKYVIILPENTVNELGWKEGQELKLEIEGNRLIVDLEKVK